MGVAKYVATLKLDDSAIYAALLHEAIKYDEYNEDEMKKAASKEVVDMVNTISKLSYFNFKHGNKVDNEILRKMFIAIAKDIKAVIQQAMAERKSPPTRKPRKEQEATVKTYGS